jgi:hypothetical protein
VTYLLGARRCRGAAVLQQQQQQQREHPEAARGLMKQEQFSGVGRLVRGGGRVSSVEAAVGGGSS